jgi:hypothetical protein|tara:strand:+ start:4110 stop:4694 length:585 start_codon:yes stop_codon:yes gene_type:complete
MPPLSKAVSIFVACVALSSHAQSANEFSDSFIREQFEKAKSDPDNRVLLDIDQSIEMVFQALLAELPDYSDDIISTLFDNSNSLRRDELDIGSRRISTMENEDILIQKIILFDPPNSFAYFTEMSESTVNAPIDYSIGLYQLTEQANGRTAVKVSAVFRPSSRLTAFLVRFAFNRAFEQDFKNTEEYLNSIRRR